MQLTSPSKRKVDMAHSIEKYLENIKSKNNVALFFAVKKLIDLSVNNDEIPLLFPVLLEVEAEIKKTLNTPEVDISKVTFKKSLFYDLLHRVGNSEIFLESHERPTPKVKTFKFKLDEKAIKLLTENPNCRVVFMSIKVDAFTTDKYIEFPSPCKFTVNDKDVIGNYKGIKGKKSSVIPFDITPRVKLREENKVSVTYNFTKEDHLVAVYIIQGGKIEPLIQRVKHSPHISAETTLKMIKDDDMDEVSASKETLSILCPCSYVRMETPVRSIRCNHIQCFDLDSYIYLQSKAPTWLCPVCNHKIKYSHLAIDDYFDSIIKKIDSKYEFVEIQSDGSWAPQIDLDSRLKPSKLPSSVKITKVNNQHVNIKEEEDVITNDIGKLIILDDKYGNQVEIVEDLVSNRGTDHEFHAPIIEAPQKTLASTDTKVTIKPNIGITSPQNKPDPLVPVDASNIIEILSDDEDLSTQPVPFIHGNVAPQTQLSPDKETVTRTPTLPQNPNKQTHHHTGDAQDVPLIVPSIPTSSSHNLLIESNHYLPQIVFNATTNHNVQQQQQQQQIGRAHV